MSAAGHYGDVLERIPALVGVPHRIDVLPGGLTNRNFTVTTESGRRLVARFACDQGSLLGIDREAEYRNSRSAAVAGVAPGVVDYSPEDGVLLVEWIDGRTFGPADLDDAATLAEVARTCARLHAGPRFVNDFDMFELQRHYLALVQTNGFRLPDRYLDFLPQVDQIRAAVAVQDEGRVPCHNDLLAANIMDDGERIWLIDFEYAGNGDACFELGNLWSESSLAPERLAELVHAYYGYQSRAKVARARLFGLMSKYGWTLWASIQSSVSEVEFDFWSWGMEKYGRAVDEFDSPQFAEWLSDVQQAV